MNKKKILLNKEKSSKKTIINNKDILVYGLTKAKYLVPLSVTVAILNRDQEEFYFIAKILSSGDGQENNGSYVLTNQCFCLQNYTPNSEQLLGFRSQHLGGTYDITPNIKEFTEEYLKFIIQLPDKQRHTNESQLQIKSKIIKQYFLENDT